MRTLVAIPVYNEARYVRAVLGRVLAHAPDVLVIDDGSTDATPRLLPEFPVEILRHAKNRGYGKSLRDAFRHAIAEDFDWLITMDCDEQHEPAAIPAFLEEAARDRSDVISGSRYLSAAASDGSFIGGMIASSGGGNTQPIHSTTALPFAGLMRRARAPDFNRRKHDNSNHHFPRHRPADFTARPTA